VRILLLSATLFETEPTVAWLRARAEREEGNVLHFGRVSIEVMFAGVGLTATAYALGHRFGGGDLPALAIQAGVGGALDTDLRLGDVVRVATERFADLGAEDRDGSFLTLGEIGLPPGPPFDETGVLHAPEGLASLPFPAVHGLSVNRVNGSAESIARVRAKYPGAQVESMEGAAFFLACLRAGVEPLQLRAVSNYVEPRNRAAWRMGEAVGALNEGLQGLLGAFISGK